MGCDSPFKKKKKSQEEKQFILDVFHLSENKKRFKDSLITKAQLKNYQQINAKKYKPIPFLRRSYQKYYLTNFNNLNDQTIQAITFDHGHTIQESQFASKTLTPNLEQIMNDSSTVDYSNNGTLDGPLSIDTSSEKSFLHSREVKNLDEDNKKNGKQNICCRTFFYENQEIKQNENESLAYLNCTYPFKYIEMIEIKKVMCSFLNSDGGNLFIGVKKFENGKKVIEVGEYSESEKENILKSFRQISQTIEPDIVTQKMYRVDFVPIKDTDDKFIPGGFVIKLNVRYGIRDDIYSYRESGQDFFPFRSQNQIIQKQGRILLKLLRQRIKNPLSIPIPLHKGPCKNPELGEHIHQSVGFQPFNKTKMEKIPISYKPKPAWPPEQTQKKRSRSPILMKKKQNQNFSTTTKIESTISSYSSTNTEKQFIKVLPDDIYNQQYQATKKELILGSKQCYFFVVGINEKQLSPVLEQKGILHQVKMQSTRQSKLVVKAFSEQVINKLRKILNKIEKKYAANNIKIYEITLSLEVSRLNRAKQILSSFTEKYQFFKNTIKFQYFRDSLKAFILLESQMEVRFIKND